jgi:predicted dehydrogenase
VITIGISGAGLFARSFIPLFQAHPLVKKVVLADVLPDRLEKVAAEFGIDETYPSHDALCESDVDAVAIFAQRHLHGPMALTALRADKHTYCAVPIASSVDDIRAILDEVASRKLVYSNGETSYYYPETIYCRERFAKGDFGEFVYGEGNYLHDMSHGFYQAYQHSGGSEWKRVAGFPPMFYPTHSTSLILSVTGARMTQVSCYGYTDRSGDGVFGAGNNLWDNPFSNETGLFRTSDGGVVRINEMRRVGWRGQHSSNPMCFYGTKASFECNSGSQHWTVLDSADVEDVSDALRIEHSHNPTDAKLHEVLQEDLNARYASVHPVHRLPESFLGQRNGHMGSHQFLADDFVKAVVTRSLPPVNAWEAAKYCVPGLIAHQSALANGEAMEIPDLGEPPADWARLDPDAAI